MAGKAKKTQEHAPLQYIKHHPSQQKKCRAYVFSRKSCFDFFMLFSVLNPSNKLRLAFTPKLVFAGSSSDCEAEPFTDGNRFILACLSCNSEERCFKYDCETEMLFSNAWEMHRSIVQLSCPNTAAQIHKCIRQKDTNIRHNVRIDIIFVTKV